MEIKINCRRYQIEPRDAPQSMCNAQIGYVITMPLEPG